MNKTYKMHSLFLNYFLNVFYLHLNVKVRNVKHLLKMIRFPGLLIPPFNLRSFHINFQSVCSLQSNRKEQVASAMPQIFLQHGPHYLAYVRVFIKPCLTFLNIHLLLNDQHSVNSICLRSDRPVTV